MFVFKRVLETGKTSKTRFESWWTGKQGFGPKLFRKTFTEEEIEKIQEEIKNWINEKDEDGYPVNQRRFYYSYSLEEITNEQDSSQVG